MTVDIFYIKNIYKKQKNRRNADFKFYLIYSNTNPLQPPDYEDH